MGSAQMRSSSWKDHWPAYSTAPIWIEELSDEPVGEAQRTGIMSGCSKCMIRRPLTT